MRENILQPPQIAPNLLPRYKRKYEENINNCSGLADSIMTMYYQQQVKTILYCILHYILYTYIYTGIYSGSKLTINSNLYMFLSSSYYILLESL